MASVEGLFESERATLGSAKVNLFELKLVQRVENLSTKSSSTDFFGIFSSEFFSYVRPSVRPEG